jgi:hypothetical protein
MQLSKSKNLYLHPAVGRKKQLISVGGDNRDRTGHLRLAKPALSQLSYIPDLHQTMLTIRLWTISLLLVGLGRLELPTSSLSGMRSNHLSYRPAGRRTNHAQITRAQNIKDSAHESTSQSTDLGV